MFQLFNCCPLIVNGQILKVLSRGQSLSEKLRERIWDKVKAKLGMTEVRKCTVMMMATSEHILEMTSGVTRDDIMKQNPGFYKNIKMAMAPKSTKLLDELNEIESDDKRVRDDYRKSVDDEIDKMVAGEENRKSGARGPRGPLEELFFYMSQQSGGSEKQGEAKGKKGGSKAVNEAIITKDRESISFEVTAVVNIDPDKSPEVFRLMKGRKTLSEEDLKILISKELETRVFCPEILKYTASDLRGNMDILAEIYKLAKQELFSWLATYGIECRRISINSAITEAERAAVIDKEMQALHEAAGRQHERDQAEMERECERLLLKRNLAAQLEKAMHANDEEKARRLGAIALAETEAKLPKEKVLQEIEKIKKETEIQGKAMGAWF